ncbi:F-box protein At3g08750-like [Neltuma alba]|uniref:F-box protein At3g08750-like n=1 Tax=Neltuma alba TaxID=207710 RepID=UPI0010A3F742|nr:F-box protein At3g08750-like [Prosopis alba]
MAGEGVNPFLPFEIIICILKRLPVKSIVRFQSVCKEWKNLFKTPSFIAEYLHHPDHKNPFLLLHEFDSERMRCSLRLVNHKLDDVEVLSIPSIDSFRRYWRIIGSCNGLLCVQVSDDGGMSHCSLWLWNPVIREVREVPNTLNDYKRSCRLGFVSCSAVSD